MGYGLSTYSIQSEIRRFPCSSAKHHSHRFIISGDGSIRAVCQDSSFGCDTADMYGFGPRDWYPYHEYAFFPSYS